MNDPIQAFIRSHVRHKKDENNKTSYPFITISRESGAGGISIGSIIVEKLNNYDLFFPFQWKYFDKDLVQLVLDNYNLPENISDYLPEAKLSVFQNIINESFNLHPPHTQLIKRINKTILALGQLGGVIIVGRGANIVTQDCENGLHIRLVSPLDKRIEHYSKYYDLNEKEAARRINEKDQGREEYVREKFKENIHNPLRYDMVLNTHSLGYSESANIIVDSVIRLYNRLNN